MQQTQQMHTGKYKSTGLSPPASDSDCHTLLGVTEQLISLAMAVILLMGG